MSGKTKLKDNFMQAARELRGASDDSASRADETAAALQSRFGGPTEAAGRPAGPRPTVVGEGAVFTGTLDSDGAVELRGTVVGNIVSRADVLIGGRLAGDASGANITVAGSRLRGNITAAHEARIDGDSVVVGDIAADTVYLNGKVKGNVTAARLLVLAGEAVLLGNARAAAVSMQEGAAVQGELSVPQAADAQAAFDDELEAEK